MQSAEAVVPVLRQLDRARRPRPVAHAATPERVREIVQQARPVRRPARLLPLPALEITWLAW